jgi:ribosome biogenesis protein GTPase yqeH
MFDVFCRFKILGNELLESGSKPIFSAYASKSVKFHVAREERVEALLNGNYFEILQGAEKEKYFQNEFVTHEVEIEENEELVIAGLGWINVKRGPLKVQLEVPENVKVIVRPSIFRNKK